MITTGKIADSLLVIAAGRKPKRKKKKYRKDAENSFDDLQTHVDSKMGFDHHNRIFRLLMRLRGALAAEGYRFLGTDDDSAYSPVSIERDVRVESPGTGSQLVCTGKLCMLLASRPPEGLDPESLAFLAAVFRSRQCYQFTLRPTDKSLVRKSGKNVNLPKPVTWPRLERYGLEKNDLKSDNGSGSMRDYRMDGIHTYTIDGKVFYVSNAEMCKRWCAGLSRAVDRALGK